MPRLTYGRAYIFDMNFVLRVSVQPKRGTALVFCNVDAHEPSIPDDSVIHCAKPVPKGHWKLGVNIWITDSNLQHLTL